MNMQKTFKELKKYADSLPSWEDCADRCERELAEKDLEDEDFVWNDTHTRYNPPMTKEQAEEAERMAQDLVEAQIHDHKYDKSFNNF